MKSAPADGEATDQPSPTKNTENTESTESTENTKKRESTEDERPSAGAATVAACTVLFGTLVSLLGISWDMQWHNDVGPDTFFTLPHVMLYTGSAVVGVTSLTMVLLATGAQRAGRSVARYGGGTPVRVFGGTFQAPLGHLVAGTGGALFLLFGLLDLWWHSMYGFDAVLDSPPHVGLFLSISFCMVGSLIVFAAAREQTWGKIGVVVSSLVLITFSPITIEAFSDLPLPVDPVIVGTVFFSVVLLITGVFVLRFRGAAFAIAGALGVMQLFLWWFSPWAAHVYADSVGLPLRDGLGGEAPSLPKRIPMLMLAVAAVTDGLLWLAHKYGWNARLAPQFTGAGAGLVVGLSMLVQTNRLEEAQGALTASDLVFMGLFGVVTGALAGFLAARFAVLLRDNSAVPDLART
ncbi:hypothetical protein ACLVWO_05910 [Streptomyces sp. CWNU-52H]|uniref:hypothetical protein n=1 Tax=Streptomyces sp. CWNU-52H TaxID=3394352 RepID=UPI0039BF6118